MHTLLFQIIILKSNSYNTAQLYPLFCANLDKSTKIEQKIRSQLTQGSNFTVDKSFIQT